MNKKGEIRSDILLTGGVPLAFAAFGLFFIFLALTSNPQNDTYLSWGLISAGVGGWLYYKRGRS